MRSSAAVIKKILFIFFDILALNISILAAFWIRLGWPFHAEYVTFLRAYLIPLILVKLSIFYLSGMYRRLWRYASMQELKVIVQAVISSSLAILVFSYGLGTLPIPRTVFIVDGLLTLMLVGGVRFSGRTFSEIKLYRRALPGVRRVLIIGAGDAGQLLAKEMLKNQALGYLPIGFIDDDPGKKRMAIHGIKVLGTREDLRDIIAAGTVGEVVIAMPSVNRQVKEGVVNICKQAGIRCRTLPGIYEIIDGQVGIAQIRDVQIEDILGRDPVLVNAEEISRFIEGKTVLITGAGGSIGSELCRRVNIFKPGMLVIVDIAENSLFEIEQELLEKPSSPVMTIVADVKDEHRMDEVLQAYHPQIIFHAAAYKHVPMMEMNPKAALENNFIGTLVLAEAAVRHRTQKFVLISTDKAVNPVNIMGMSKALAERVILSMPPAETDFIAVRFGNVLASRGSVVPTFQRQIAAGGPVTVTHPDMKRYLMTIAESVQLVLQAAAFGRGDEVFMLDMGEQVSIVELAEKLIRLSGFDLEKMPIKYTGIRQGEKIAEELFSNAEIKAPSQHEKIFKLKSDYDRLSLGQQMHDLETLIQQGHMRAAFSKMRSLLPTGEKALEKAPTDAVIG